MSHKSAKIDLLQKKISKLENLLHNFNNIKMEVKEDEVLPQQIFGRATIAFSEKVSHTRQYFHYFSDATRNELEEISGKIGLVFFEGKTGKEIDLDGFKKLFERIQAADKDLLTEIADNLGNWQKQLDKLLFDDDNS